MEETDKIEDRATGRTTRLANEYIDRLFKGEEVEIKDHHNNGKSKQSNELLQDLILRRINREHSNLYIFHTVRYSIANTVKLIRKYDGKD